MEESIVVADGGGNREVGLFASLNMNRHTLSLAANDLTLIFQINEISCQNLHRNEMENWSSNNPAGSHGVTVSREVIFY